MFKLNADGLASKQTGINGGLVVDNKGRIKIGFMQYMGEAAYDLAESLSTRSGFQIGIQKINKKIMNCILKVT